ncbi:hypothetical protein IANJMKHF_00249 [Klebsiella phage CPRSA]|nr:hypothetical protein IANJMKHF_00249 [Klebsiella phage CPRSA]
MKIRSGFVSNSSSSSFIVRFPKDPTDINNLREMMGDCVPNCGYSWMTCPTAEEVVQQVHRDLGGHMGNSFESYYDDKRYEWKPKIAPKLDIGLILKLRLLMMGVTGMIWKQKRKTL